MKQLSPKASSTTAMAQKPPREDCTAEFDNMYRNVNDARSAMLCTKAFLSRKARGFFSGSFAILGVCTDSKVKAPSDLLLEQLKCRKAMKP